MRNAYAMVLGLLIPCALSGCLSSDGPRRDPADARYAAAQGDGSLVVTTRMERTRSVYTEGAIPEVVLRDATGSEVGTVRGSGQLQFADLSPGDYVIEPALRPCDGNCGTLDERTDSCSANVHVGSHSTRVRVVYRPGEGCKVSPDS